MTARTIHPLWPETIGTHNVDGSTIGDTMGVAIDFTAETGTGLLDVEVLWSPDGTNYGSAESADSFTQITAAGVVAKRFDVKAEFYRIEMVVSGTGVTKEVQDLVHDHSSGTFTISFNDETASSAINWNDNGASINTYLETLTYEGNAITVTVVENSTGNWTITYDTPYENVPEIVIEDNSLSGGTTIDLTETTPGVPASVTFAVAVNQYA